jgi:disulfide bond formation protein DsbB
MFQMMKNPRLVFALIAACGLLLLGYAHFAQYVQGLEPCPLCMFQRIAMFAVTIWAGIAALHAPRSWGWRVYGVGGLVLSALGAGLSGWHVRQQLQPPDLLGSCAPPLDVLVQGVQFGSLKIGDMLARVLEAKGDCAKVDWTFLGLSMPAWVFIWFAIMGLAMSYSAFARWQHKAS